MQRGILCKMRLHTKQGITMVMADAQTLIRYANTLKL